MESTVISALISGGITLVVCLITNHASAEKTRALLEYKVDQLTKRMDKHNSVIERTYRLEELTTLQAEQIRVANHRIADLEKR